MTLTLRTRRRPGPRLNRPVPAHLAIVPGRTFPRGIAVGRTQPVEIA